MPCYYKKCNGTWLYPAAIRMALHWLPAGEAPRAADSSSRSQTTALAYMILRMRWYGIHFLPFPDATSKYCDSRARMSRPYAQDRFPGAPRSTYQMPTSENEKRGSYRYFRRIAWLVSTG